MEVPLLFVSFPSVKDPSWDNEFPERSTCELVTVAPWSWFETWAAARPLHRGEEYEELKEAIGRAMWRQAVEMFPDLEDKVGEHRRGRQPRAQRWRAAGCGVSANRRRWLTARALSFVAGRVFQGGLSPQQQPLPWGAPRRALRRRSQHGPVLGRLSSAPAAAKPREGAVSHRPGRVHGGLHWSPLWRSVLRQRGAPPPAVHRPPASPCKVRATRQERC